MYGHGRGHRSHHRMDPYIPRHSDNIVYASLLLSSILPVEFGLPHDILTLPARTMATCYIFLLATCQVSRQYSHMTKPRKIERNTKDREVQGEVVSAMDTGGDYRMSMRHHEGERKKNGRRRVSARSGNEGTAKETASELVSGSTEPVRQAKERISGGRRKEVG